MDYRQDEYAKMNANQQQAGVGAVDSRYNGTATQNQLQQLGVSSAMKQLAEAIADSDAAAAEIARYLGVSSPENGAKMPEPSNMAAVVHAMTARIREANQTLSRCIQHLNG